MVLAIVLVAGVARADLVAHYEFECNFNDSSSNGHTGTPVGDATTVGGKLSLDGDGDWVDLGTDSDFDLTNAFTIAAWIKADVLLDNTPVVNKYGSELVPGYIPRRGWYFRVEPTGAIKTRVAQPDESGTSLVSETGLGVVEVGTWAHMATTYEYVASGTSKIRLYLNGDLVGSTDTAVGPVNTISDWPARIGVYQYNTESYSRYFDGLMDDVRIYDHTMTGAEVAGIVPEPMTVALLAFGGLALYRRRRA